MELLRRLLGGSESECGCGHPPTVHWRSDDGKRMWCSAPGCSCSHGAEIGDERHIWLEEGDGYRIVGRGARARKSA